jgi:hypothetical protein
LGYASWNFYKVSDIHAADEPVWSEVHTVKSLISEAGFYEIEVGITNFDFCHN